MKKKIALVSGFIASASVAMATAVPTPSVDSIISDTTNVANTVLTSVLAIGAVVLAWKLLRKFFSKTG